MKIRKGNKVSASCNACGIPAAPSTARKDAVDLIKSAIDVLATDPEDQICKDSIANLSVVVLDLGADSPDIPGVTEVGPLVPDYEVEVDVPEDAVVITETPEV